MIFDFTLNSIQIAIRSACVISPVCGPVMSSEWGRLAQSNKVKKKMGEIHFIAALCIGRFDTTVV